ncbi:hypothetical protein [Ammoniphilus sp. CFH 90114]|uniref:hypothetical protein n=1 Tax=Ammoniphilus sp. CFH 90114 TaxID=2493665 RepID=UPI0013E926A7|nr:hypothetical protein [Ammoniphilus sp. CFH 90114]
MENNQKTTRKQPSHPFSIHHYDSALDPDQLEEGRVEGLSVYEMMYQKQQERNNKTT